MKTRLILLIDGKEYVHSFGRLVTDAEIRVWMHECQPGTTLLRVENYRS